MDSEKQLYTKIGKLIRVQRNKKKLTQNELAMKVGLTRTSITNIESGSQKIQIHDLYSIAQVFNIPVQSLLPEIELSDTNIMDTLPSGLKPNVQKWLVDLLDQAREGTRYEDKKKNGDTK
ncbi:MAG TPA: helix-turn-helix transcriptional regulator [Thermodesulfobacteriota bacterium]|nr:helix-turn-helix transcriptional regulator [Thermodesulfobacteriota bacterium]